MSRDPEFRARDKKTHKMTRDGLVERNETTGEEQRVSQRRQDFQMRQPQAEQPSFYGRDTPAGHSRRQPRTGDTQPPEPDSFGQGQHPDPFETGAPPLSYDFRQADTPIRPDAHTAPTQDSGGSKPSLLKQLREDRSRAAPGEAPRGKQRGTAYQQRFADNAPAPEEGRSPAQPAAEAPEKGPNSPNAAQDAPLSHTAPIPEAPPHGANAPSPPRPHSPSEDAPHPADPDRHSTGHSPMEERSRLRFGEEQPCAGDRASPRDAQHGSRYARKFAADAAGPDASEPSKTGSSAASDSAGGPAPTDADAPKPGNPKLQFTADEKPPEPLGKKLTSARRKAERADGKLEKAREKLPTRRRVRVKKTPDPDTGKVKRALHFEKEVKTRRQHLKGPVPLRPVKAVGNTAVRYGHKKLFEVEEENVGTKAAHRTEMAAEGVARSAYRFVKTRPYRRVAKLQHKSMKANVRLSYQKALHDNPQLKKNLLARMWQKQKIKRQYAKAAREAKRTGKTVKQAASAAGKVAQAVAGFVRRHPVLCVSIALLLLLLFFIMAAFSSCSNMAGGGMSAIFMSSYTAADTDIDNAELAYREWETDLQFQVDNAESDYPSYDEYWYSVDDIAHNPYELMAYLTAKHQDFTFAEVEADLRAIFAEQYQLTFIPEVETRYNDPDDSDDDGDYEPYDWHILHVTLTARSFTDAVAGRMDTDQREHYDLLMETRGNRQYTLSPFDFDWIPYISCYYGWRVHPITGARDNHRAVDIAVAQNTEILAAHDGVVTTATWHDSYGNYISLDDGNGLVTKYAHCAALLVSQGQEVKQGDVIAKVGSTGDSTGPHLHFEVIKDGVYLNPLFFSETIDDGTGGAAPGTPGGPDFPEYPGTPMGNGDFAALMEEAQKHLGKPYVFGASGPDTFDCSGFVSYVLSHSTHPGFGRTNAQGIYNQCTPVSPANAQPGDLIFFSGTYSTPNATSHIGIYIGNGQMIHAGSPVQYASINSSYWQEHFYAFARLS